MPKNFSFTTPDGLLWAAIHKDGFIRYENRKDGELFDIKYARSMEKAYPGFILPTC